MGYQAAWFSANKAGYSGVATFFKTKPLHITRGMQDATADAEGRVLRLDFLDFTLLNIYMPSGSSGENRQRVKYQFLDAFFEYSKGVLREAKDVIICGDFNIAHTPIDIHNPVANKNSPGFLPQERAWFSDFLSLGFFDVFRQRNPQAVSYSWWSYRSQARAKNLGWRIDYFLCTSGILKKITSLKHAREVTHSDHCPLILECNSTFI